MEAEVKIVQVLSSGKGSDEHSLIFKVKLQGQDSFAFVHFDVAKKKYPQAVLQYLIARIKQKPVEKSANSTENVQKQVKRPPQKHQDEQVKKQMNKFDQFFSACKFCLSKNSNTKMLDYDAIVDITSSLAYPTYFKLKPQSDKNNKIIKEKQPAKRNKKVYDQDYK